MQVPATRRHWRHWWYWSAIPLPLPYFNPRSKHRKAYAREGVAK
jgi:hypothetical protein